jgi:PAS domain S-box-containing protein
MDESTSQPGANRGTERLLHGLIDESADSFYEMDDRGYLVNFSNSLCKVMGHPRERLQNQRLDAFMDDKQARRFRDALNKVWVSHQRFSNLAWETTDGAGNRRVIELSAFLVKNHQGKKLGFRGIARDATEKFQTISALKEAQERYEREFEAKRRARRKTKNLFDFVPYPMIVFTSSGKTTYINPAFTKVFGWTLEELIGREVPYIPPGLEEEARNILNRFRENPEAVVETKRMTKDGRIRDVSIRGQLSQGIPDISEELFILRDVTEERRNERINETLFQVSRALPRYPELEDLLDFISDEVKRLLNTDGAVVGLFDDQQTHIEFLGVADGGGATGPPVERSGHSTAGPGWGGLAQRGEATVLTDPSGAPGLFRELEEAVGFAVKNLTVVPLEAGHRRIGMLIAVNKKGEAFDQKDRRLLTMIAGTVALSVANAQYSKELKEAYREVASLNRAKEKIINHLSHELKTPVSVLLASLSLLKTRLGEVPEEKWSATFERAERNLQRILEIQYQVQDIMRGREYRVLSMVSSTLGQCVDELEALLAEKVGEGEVVQWLRDRLEEEFGLTESIVEEIDLRALVEERLQALSEEHAHRRLEVVRSLEPGAPVHVPRDVMEKVVDGLVRNAVENTPDGGRVELSVRERGNGIELAVKDTGVGIDEEDRRRIFEGFFATQDTMDYSSKRPFDFNAGGKGADLLRMKVFSERYGFQLSMTSNRCRFLEQEGAACPGSIDRCGPCRKEADCLHSGGSTFRALFRAGGGS